MTQVLEAVPDIKIEKIWPCALGLVLLVAAGFAVAYLPLADWFKAFGEWIRGMGVIGVVAFALFYVFGTVALISGAAMTIAGGAAFGFWAVPLVVLCASIGASLSFLISRYVIRNKVRSVLRGRRKLEAVAQAIDRGGWCVALLVRLSPAVPFNVQNYLYGVTNISLPAYLSATVLGMIPGTIGAVYMGVLGTAAGQGRTPMQWGLLIAGVIATVAAGGWITWYARQQLKKGNG